MKFRAKKPLTSRRKIEFEENLLSSEAKKRPRPWLKNIQSEFENPDSEKNPNF